MQYTLCMYANISIYMYIYIYTAKCLLKLGSPKPLVSNKALVQFWTILGPPLKKIHMDHQSICHECFVWTGVQELLSDTL
jgi:hypothetical protein